MRRCKKPVLPAGVIKSPFVRPQYTSHIDGNFATATRADGLYGVDVEGGSRNMDLEQDELGDIDGEDWDVPAEMPSAKAHNESQEFYRAAYSGRSRASRCHTLPLSELVCRIAASAKEDPHARKSKKTRRWACL